MTNIELGKVIRDLTLEYPFFGHLAMKLKKEIVPADHPHVKTAAVALDPVSYNMKLLINSGFWDGLTKEQQRGVIHHEILHVAFRHLESYDQFPDPKKANIAMDMEINQLIPRNHLPQDGVFLNVSPWSELNLPPNKGTRFYYDALRKEEDNGNQAVKDAIQQAKDHGFGKSMKGLTSAQKKLVKNQQDHIMKTAVQETGGPKSMGKLPGSLQRELEKLFDKTPPVFNWKSFFRRYIGTVIDIQRKKTHKRSSKRFGDGSPGLRTKRKQKVFVSVDVSGSMGMKEVAEGFEQLNHIWKAGAEIDVVTWDSAIQEKFKYNGKVPKTLSGGGGSDIGLPIREFNKHKRDYTFAVHFTDGYVMNSEPLFGRHLFIITSQGQKFDPGKGNATMVQIPKKQKK